MSIDAPQRCVGPLARAGAIDLLFFFAYKGALMRKGTVNARTIDIPYLGR